MSGENLSLRVPDCWYLSPGDWERWVGMEWGYNRRKLEPLLLNLQSSGEKRDYETIQDSRAVGNQALDRDRL